MPLFGGNKEAIMLQRIADMLGPLNWDASPDHAIQAANRLKQCAPCTTMSMLCCGHLLSFQRLRMCSTWHQCIAVRMLDCTVELCK